MTQHALLAAIKEYEPELIKIRHDIHAHPEIGLEEHRTAALVAERLRSWGLAVTEGIGRTGVVATLKGTQPGPARDRAAGGSRCAQYPGNSRARVCIDRAGQDACVRT